MKGGLTVTLRSGNRRGLSLTRRKGFYGYVFIAPWLVGTVLVFAYPILYSIVISFSEIINVTENKLQFVGLANYVRALMEDVTFVPTYLETIRETLLNTPLINVFAMYIALLLNRDIRCRGLFRATFFLPVMLGTGFIMQQLLGQKVDADAMEVARGLLLPDQLTLYLGPSVTGFIQNFLSKITIILWKSGVQIIIYLAGLQSISNSVYEAARVDSATEWEIFWLITLPMMAPIILLNLIYTVVDSFTDASNPVVAYIYQIGFEGPSQFEFASAMSWFYFLFVILLVGLIFLIMRHFVNNVSEKS